MPKSDDSTEAAELDARRNKTERMRLEFERVCRIPSTLESVQFPLGIMEVNDQFMRYMDSDTDSAWIGFAMGLNRAQQLLTGNARDTHLLDMIDLNTYVASHSDDV